jgi:large subunit ribosomal protein L4
MKADLFNIEGKKTGTIDLPKSIFEAKINEKLLAQAIRVAQSNLRSAHAKAKHRGEVAGTTKKMYAQKGTGNARHSTAKAPQFVGGGSAHGPRGNQNYKLKLTKGMKIAAIKTIYSKFAKNSAIIAIEKLSAITPKTKIAQTLIDKLSSQNEQLHKSKRIGLVISKPTASIKRSFGNIPGINLLSLSSLNPYNLSCQNFLIFTKKSINKLSH